MLALGGETASEDEAPNDQAQEADAAGDQVAQAMPADGRGRAGRGPWREALGRVGGQQARGDQAGTVDSDQDRPPATARAAAR